MKIAIIGAGNVGGALGTNLAAKGHEIRFGIRDRGDARYVSLTSTPRTSLVSPRDAVPDADLVILATPWPATREAIEGCGDLAGKIVIDCTNPIRDDFTGLEDDRLSGGEKVAQWAAGARVVKCFNQTGFKNMAGADFGTHKPLMFAAGDDGEAVAIVVSLAQELGFEGIPLKGLKRSKELECLAWLWIDLAVLQNKGPDFAFAILKR